MNEIYIKNGIIAAGIVTAIVVAVAAIRRFYREFMVSEGCLGLLYDGGRYTETLGAGRHIRWGRKFALVAYDIRKASMVIPSQDVLTSDNVGLKVSLLVAYRVVDPVKAAHENQNWHAALHQMAQMALRTIVANAPFEALMGRRLDIGGEILGRVRNDAALIGIEVESVGIRDAILPPDLKRAYADVLKAKQEGQAALERARGESAALRNLANAARMLDGNPALMNLRFMQSLTTANAAGNTLVVGVPGGFVPLKSAKAPDAETPPDPSEAS